MRIYVKELSETRRQMDVVVPAEVVQKKFDEVVREYGRKASVPGFRQGKAPVHLVKQRYKTYIKQDVIDRLFPETYREALEEKKIVPVFHPIVTQMKVDEGTPLEMTVLVDVRPRVELKTYKGLAAKRPVYKVEDKNIQDALTYLQEQRAEYKPREDKNPLVMGDVCLIDIVVTHEGKTIHQDTKRAVRLEEKHPFQDLVSYIVGMTIGQNKKENVVLRDAALGQEYAGKEVAFDVTVTEAYTKTVPAIDDEFAKDWGPFTSLEELTKVIRENMERERSQKSQNEVDNALVKALLENHPLPLPETLVLEQKRLLEERWVERLERQGVGAKEAKGYVAAQDKNFREQAERIIRREFVFEAIAEAEKLTVSDAEVDVELEAAAAQQKKNKDLLRKEWQESGQWGQVWDNLRNKKVLDFLTKEALLEEVVSEYKADAQMAEADDEADADHDHGAGHVHDENCRH